MCARLDRATHQSRRNLRRRTATSTVTDGGEHLFNNVREAAGSTAPVPPDGRTTSPPVAAAPGEASTNIRRAAQRVMSDAVTAPSNTNEPAGRLPLPARQRIAARRAWLLAKTPARAVRPSTNLTSSLSIPPRQQHSPAPGGQPISTQSVSYEFASVFLPLQPPHCRRPSRLLHASTSRRVRLQLNPLKQAPDSVYEAAITDVTFVPQPSIPCRGKGGGTRKSGHPGLVVSQQTGLALLVKVWGFVFLPLTPFLSFHVFTTVVLTALPATPPCRSQGTSDRVELNTSPPTTPTGSTVPQRTLRYLPSSSRGSPREDGPMVSSRSPQTVRCRTSLPERRAQRRSFEYTWKPHSMRQTHPAGQPHPTAPLEHPAVSHTTARPRADARAAPQPFQCRA